MDTPSIKSIPRMGLGVYLVPMDEVKALVADALAVGYRLIDSAPVHGNEEQSARGIAEYITQHNLKRSEVWFSTRVFPDYSYTETKNALEKSVRHVRDSVGHIDIVLLHTPEGTPDSIIEGYKAIQEFVDRGEVKHIGLVNFGIRHIEHLLQWDGLKHAPQINQIEVNPWFQQDQLVDFCHDKNIVVAAGAPLIQGKRLSDPELLKLSEKYNKTPAQILIQWSLQKGYIPLPKSIRKERIRENFAGYDTWRLDIEDLNALGNKRERYGSISKERDYTLGRD